MAGSWGTKEETEVNGQSVNEQVRVAGVGMCVMGVFGMPSLASCRGMTTLQSLGVSPGVSLSVSSLAALPSILTRFT